MNKDVQKEVARQAAMAKMLAEQLDDEYRKQRILSNVADIACTPLIFSLITAWTIFLDF